MITKGKRLKWTDFERTLLLNDVIAGIEIGESITKVCEEFAKKYDLPISSVKAQWGKVIAPKNKLIIQVARHKWNTVVKPNQEAELKRQKAQEKAIIKSRKMRKEWRKKKDREEKKANKLSVGIHTNKYPKPEHSRMYVTINEYGMVTNIKE